MTDVSDCYRHYENPVQCKRGLCNEFVLLQTGPILCLLCKYFNDKQVYVYSPCSDHVEYLCDERELQNTRTQIHISINMHRIIRIHFRKKL